jgi:hypothetical protein
LQTNIILSDQTASSVDARVDKILKDLGNPKPPLSLEQVRQLLKLDLRYYSTADTSWLKEKIHQLKVAGKQVLSAPSTILAVTKSLGLKGVLLVDRRRILLDTDVAEPKLRWNEAHEITHDILPWHEGIAHGDPEATLSPSCHEQIEAEANYGAGRLLFCGTTFREMVRSSTISFKLVKELHAKFGNTMTTTLWRVVEATQHCAFGFVSVHPARVTGDPDKDIRYFIRSPRFISVHSTTSPTALFTIVCSQCYGTRGPIGNGIVHVADDRGTKKAFTFETFWNSHDALTIGHYV